MQVPMVASHVLELVAVADLNPQDLLLQLESINVFKAFPAEVRIPSSQATARAWWVAGGEGASIGLTQLITEVGQFFPQQRVRSANIVRIFIIELFSEPAGFEIPTLFNVKATPISGIKDLQLQTENLLKEMDNEIFHKNILLYHLVDRIEMVEHLSESPQKLVEQWEQCTGGTDGHKTN